MADPAAAAAGGASAVAAGAAVAAAGENAAEILLHPLVITSIGDHRTRIQMQDEASDGCVYGLLYGLQTGNKVELMLAFEMLYAVTPDGVQVDQDYIKTNNELLEPVYEGYELLGWYATATNLGSPQLEAGETPASDSFKAKVAEWQQLQARLLAIHRQMVEFNASPLFLNLDPNIKHDQKDLPITIFGAEYRRDAAGNPTMVFVDSPYKMDATEAERVTVDALSDMRPPDSRASAVDHSFEQAGIAVGRLQDRIAVVLEYLRQVKAGKLQASRGLLREIAGLCARLPVAGPVDRSTGGSGVRTFDNEMLAEFSDSMVLAMLASLARGTASMDDMVGKVSHQVIAERQLRMSLGNFM